MSPNQLPHILSKYFGKHNKQITANIILSPILNLIRKDFKMTGSGLCQELADKSRQVQNSEKATPQFLKSQKIQRGHINDCPLYSVGGH